MEQDRVSQRFARLDELIAREAWLLSEWPHGFARAHELKIVRYAMRGVEREMDDAELAAIMDSE